MNADNLGFTAPRGGAVWWSFHAAQAWPRLAHIMAPVLQQCSTNHIQVSDGRFAGEGLLRMVGACSGSEHDAKAGAAMPLHDTRCLLPEIYLDSFTNGR